MDKNVKAIIEKRIEKTVEALKKNRIDAYYVEDICKARELFISLISKDDVISFGGSESLKQCGILDLLHRENYKLLDRSVPGLTKDDIQKIYRDTFSADVFLCSSNAITENGELYNVDGTGNRVAAMIFGPKSVIVIAGYNKIVGNLNDAVKRVKTIAASANCVRLNKDTYCAKCGKCASLSTDKNPEMAAGCSSDDRICRSYTVLGPQAVKGRIKVIIVGEELGY